MYFQRFVSLPDICLQEEHSEKDEGKVQGSRNQARFYILDYINKSLAKARGYNIFHWHTVHTGHKVQNILRVKELSRYKCFAPIQAYYDKPCLHEHLS